VSNTIWRENCSHCALLCEVSISCRVVTHVPVRAHLVLPCRYKPTGTKRRLKVHPLMVRPPFTQDHRCAQLHTKVSARTVVRG
jgi:hypothetical protein